MLQVLVNQVKCEHGTKYDLRLADSGCTECDYEDVLAELDGEESPEHELETQK